MRWIWYSAAVLLFNLTSVLAQQNGGATTNVTRPISLEEGVRLALEHNLGLKIERLAPQIAGFNLAGSYSYYEPVFALRGEQSFRSSPGGFNPSLNIQTPARDTWTEHFNAGLAGKTPTGMKYDMAADLSRSSGTRIEGFEYRTDAAVNFSQPLLRDFWIDADRLAIKVNKRLVKIAQYAFEFQVMDTINRVQQAYYDLIFARENVKVREKALELALRSVDENKRRVEIGTLAPLDEKQSQSQSATAAADLIVAQNQLATAENVFKTLITDQYTDWHAVRLEPTESLMAVPESFNLPDSWSRALAIRPDYNQLKEELERQNLLLKYSYNQLFPSLDLLGSVGRNGLDSTLGGSVEDIRGGDFPRWSGGAVLTIPLTRTLERNNYKRSKAEQKQALYRLKKLEQDIVVQIDDAVAKARSDYQRIQATRQAREFAEAALQAEQTKLENGKSTSFVVLELQNKLTQARSAEIQAQADYKKSLSEFYFREGTTLERNKIIVTDK